MGFAIKKNSPPLSNYTRFEFNNIPVYIDSEYPNWVVPNGIGDNILKRISASGVQSGASSDTKAFEATQGEVQILGEISKKKFLNSLPNTPHEEYRGRSEYLVLSHIEECWLHITDNCNLKCTHCLFSCSHEDTATKPAVFPGKCRWNRRKPR